MKTRLPLLFVLLVGAGCRKDAPDAGLPPATQEGKNTAGFLLNGQPWLPQRSPLTTGPFPFGATWSRRPYQGGRGLQLHFSRHRSDADVTALNLLFPDVRRPGTFALNQAIDPASIAGPRPPFAVYSVYEPGPDRLFYTGATARGQVLITRFDTVARVVAGTFAATVREDGGTDSLRITQGRFDLSF
jgi:hypothetical protein